MVMPHSVLQTGQYAKWRTGSWQAGRSGRILAVDFSYKTAWDLERMEPNTFFPIPASVAFAERIGESGEAMPFDNHVERWLGKTGSNDVQRLSVLRAMTGTSTDRVSDYDSHSPKRSQTSIRESLQLYFVNETFNPSVILPMRSRSDPLSP